MPHFEKDSQLEKVNFRPVTVLSEVSRIFERILHHQLADHFENIFHNYSRLPITRTLKGNWKQVRFNGSLKQITGSKEISKWIGWGGRNAIKQQSIQGWTLNLNWSDKKVKMKNWLGCFEINSMFRTSVHGFLPDSSRVYNMARVIEGKIVWKWSERKKNYFEFAGGSSYRGFELPKVRVSKCNSKCKKEIQGKSTSVRVSARFELARVRVIESQLYMFGYRKYHDCPTALLSFTDRTMGERSRQTQYHWHDSHWFKQGFWMFIT